jgi:hypothetical protein
MDEKFNHRDLVSATLPGISMHVIDIARGVVAAGMRVELFAVDAADHRIGPFLLPRGSRTRASS